MKSKLSKKHLPATVVVNDRMQSNYRYGRTEPPGENFVLDFNPELTPAQLLNIWGQSKNSSLGLDQQLSM